MTRRGGPPGGRPFPLPVRPHGELADAQRPDAEPDTAAAWLARPRDTRRPVVLVGFVRKGNLGIGYLSAMLRRHGYEVHALDVEDEPEALVQRVRALRPLLVGFSLIYVGLAVATFLHGKRRRRLAVVAGDDERSKRRHDAFCQTARELGLPEVQVVVVPAPTTLRSGRMALGDLLQRPAGVDAVFCSSDLLALGVMTEAHARGLAIPSQLAVVGFGDNEFAADLDPALTTVRIDGASIGRQAARFIVDRAEGRGIDLRVVDIGFSILDRASV